MSKILDIREDYLRVLSLFTRGYDREIYIREVARYLPISRGTAQTALEYLEAKQVLRSVTRGRTRLFSLRRGDHARDFCTLAEVYRRICLREEEPFLAGVLNRIVPHIEGSGAVFGSRAEGTADEESDLDLFVAGECRREEIERIGEIYGLKIHLTVYPLKIFDRDLHTDPFLREVLRNHVLIKGTEHFVEKAVG
ncbi:nucleotidyltransferase domain-containing protein [Methanoculleus bourgensis]|uniref:nucleotidyltransferase domain-containing protein n=1 Tax=Methanoculleus bourgensis TaxID=83986 RepID=UPI003B938126